MYDKERIRESLTIDDIHIILKDLGSYEPKHDRHGNPIYTTVCHGGHKHKLYYFQESKIFHCFTDCSCSFNIFDLVIKAKEQQGYTYSFPQTIQYVVSLTGKSYIVNNKFQELQNERISDWQWINKLNRKKQLAVNLPEYDEKVLDVFMPYPHISWINEGITYETQQKYEISYYMRDERIVIPHRSIDSRLVGIRGRAMSQEDIDNGRKYMPLTVGNTLYNHQTMFNLYGLNNTKDAIRKLKKVAIFEGEKSVLKCEDYYGESNFSVACCSSNITAFHRNILLSLGIEEVIICFDRFRDKIDTETEEKYQERIEEYQEKLLKFARMFTPYVRTYIVWDDFGIIGFKESPVDKGKEVLEQLMKCKYEIKTSGCLNEV